MEVRTEPRQQHADSDARLAVGVAAACAAAMAALLLAAPGVHGEPSGPDVLWMLGSVTTVVLGPVAAGLACWSSVLALWRSDPPPVQARRLHLVTLVLTGGFAVAFAVAWTGGVFASFSG